MKFKLYFAPGACSFVPHAMLQVAQADYEPVIVKLHKNEQQSPEYLALNPNGQVPVLVTQPGTPQARALTQIVAIVNYLNDVFPQAQFLPTEPLAKAQALSTLMWINNTVHPTFTHIFMPQKFSDDVSVQANLKTFNQGLYAKQLAQLNRLVEQMNSRQAPYLLGAHIGPLDFYALTLTRWGGLAGIDPSAHNAPLWQHVQKVAQHPGVVPVMERERLQLNVYPKNQS